MIVVCNDVIFSQEDIQFIHFGFPRIAILFSVHIVEHDIKIISPIIEFGNMSFLQGIVNCQWMKLEILQDGEAGFRRFTDKIHP